MSATTAFGARLVQSEQVRPRGWALAVSVAAHVAVIGSVAAFVAHRADLPDTPPEGAVALVFAAVLPEPTPVDGAASLDFTPPAAEAATPQLPPAVTATTEQAFLPAAPVVPVRPPAVAPPRRVGTAVPQQPAAKPDLTPAPAPPTPARPVAGMESARPPAYPESARRRGEQGRVVLRVDVSADGLPVDVSVAEGSGFPSLDAAALGAVRQWRFVPAISGGTPVAATAQVPIRFRLAN